MKIPELWERVSIKHYNKLWALTEISMNYSEPQTGSFLKLCNGSYDIKAKDISQMHLLLECIGEQTDCLRPASLYLGSETIPP